MDDGYYTREKQTDIQIQQATISKAKCVPRVRERDVPLL